MLAMQYKIDFPDKFDMDRIRQRIADKGHLLDGYEGLVFKAYLYSEADNATSRNRYAPFYVWHDSQAMWRFLGSEGFAKLCEDFGRPKVNVWYLNDRKIFRDIDQTSHVMIGESQRKPMPSLASANDPGCLAVIEAIDPWSWESVTVYFARIQPSAHSDRATYVCGYLAHGADFDSVKATV
ncbi:MULTISPECIES: DUF4865 family protein [unclassified Brevundimonas]|uniref:DUF4865 family protein n=1 Tax=unclassified Brevundimonas TaxID=2622653 RepID=UPI0025BDF944|nr:MULTISPECIES: DUF4865 family protein [unclassified Brevundimonas]